MISTLMETYEEMKGMVELKKSQVESYRGSVDILERKNEILGRAVTSF